MRVTAKQEKDGIIFPIRVAPSAKKKRLEVVDGCLKVWVSAPPDGGRANKAVIEALKILSPKCEIISGIKSKNKRIYAPNMSLGGFESFLAGLGE
jgi:uncharacterized protein